MFGPQFILGLFFFKLVAGVNKEQVFGLAVFLKNKHSNRNADSVKEIWRKADNGIQNIFLNKLLSDNAF